MSSFLHRCRSVLNHHMSRALTSPPPSAPNRTFPSVTALFLVAFALRLIVLLQLQRHSPFVEFPGADGRFYDEWAHTIVSTGDWIGTNTFFQSPLYPYFLATFYTLFGFGHFKVVLAQSILGSCVPVLVCLITLRLGGTRRAAILSGLLAALHPVFVFSDTMVMKSVFLEFFTAGMLLLVIIATERPNRGRRWLLAGLALGFAILARETILLFVPVLLIWIAVLDVPAYRAALRRSLHLLAGVALVILPVTARNYYATGAFVLITTGAGEVFYIGNNPQATGDYQVPAFVTPTSIKSQEHFDFIRAAQARTGQPLTPSQSSAFWIREGVRFLADNPARAVALYARKLMVLINNFERPDDQCLYFNQRYSSAMRALPLNFAAIFALGLAGMFLLRPRSAQCRLLLLFGAVYALSTVVFFIYSRFRLPLLVVLMVFAGITLDRVLRWIAARRVTPLLLTGAALAGLYAASDNPFFGGRADFAILHYNAGLANWDLGRLDQAAEDLQESLRINPAFPLAHTALGNLYGTEGRADEAVAHLDRAIAIKPDYADAYLQRAIVRARTGQTARARADFETAQTLQAQQAPVLPGSERTGEMARARANEYYRFGRALQAAGNLPDAAAAFREAIRLNPAHGGAELDLGAALAGLGQREEARAHFAAALRLNPAQPEALHNLGVLLTEDGQWTAAEEHFRAALRARPNYASARTALGALHLRQGNAAGAREQFAAVVDLQPLNPATHLALGQALEAERRLPEALAQYREALRLKPDDGEAQAAIRRLGAASP